MQEPTLNTQLQDAPEFGFANGSVVAAPVPFKSPALGSGLALGGAWLFSDDAGSDGSSIGLGAFRTSNGSEGIGAGLSFNLDNNRWQVSFLAASADLNYDLFVLGIPVPITQSANAVDATFEYGFQSGLSLGFGLSYAETTIGLQRGEDGILPQSVQLDSDLAVAKFRLLANYDTRDDSYYPTTGTLFSGQLAYGEVTNIGQRDYLKGVLKAAAYRPVFSEGVIAGRLTACAAEEAAPFFDSCAIGPTDGFRGFSSTQYLDDALFSVQAEYRGRITNWLGFVVFAGAGSVDDDLAGAVTGEYQTAAGLGARIRLSKSYPLDYSIDYSINNDDEKLLYISVGQRF
ncbi:BamA/TamA family outer membrane protein [Sulfitobacter sp. D35]|uniref:BamA/TamA family outer membrane protein n=1 Tax=Sulfitobacter sp. D35 TaxID=3083252 RepID=UPI00296F793C|nr:BamA/TamA family outer membrane protein [Sulfitobacter sp. D35]MDW4497226.1 BamA/TamA family outer membrane protein [Sulfitobacter sp. D35]